MIIVMKVYLLITYDVKKLQNNITIRFKWIKSAKCCAFSTNFQNIVLVTIIFMKLKILTMETEKIMGTSFNRMDF